jgi:hypothetical protein
MCTTTEIPLAILLPDKPANSISHTLTPTSLPSLPPCVGRPLDPLHATHAKFIRGQDRPLAPHCKTKSLPEHFHHLPSSHICVYRAWSAASTPILTLRSSLPFFSRSPSPLLPSLSLSSSSQPSSVLTIVSSVRWQHLRQMWWGCITGWARRSERGHLV